MEWFRTHPYTLALGAAAVLIVIGAFVVASHSSAPLSSSILTWGGGIVPTSYQAGSTSSQSLTPEQIADEVIQNQGGQNVILPSLTSSTSSILSPNSDLSYEAILAQLLASTSIQVSSSGTTSSSNILSQAYQFIPQGLVASTPTTKKMTDEQQTLYLYGNDLGGEIQSFETLHTNEVQVLKDQAEDRTDPVKAAALVSLGQAIGGVGTFMQGMQEVPSSVTSLHGALAQSYLDIGAKLQLVAKAQNDADFVQAVQNYDTSANTFVQNYASLAQYFAAQGVVFSSQDPGSVFSFSQTGGF